MSEKDLKRIFERAAVYHPNFFPAEIGIDAQKYHQGEPAEYAAVQFYAEQGWIHGVHANVVPLEDGGVRVEIDHWVHRPDGKNILTRFMELEAHNKQDDEKGQVTVVVDKITLQGKTLDVSNRKTLNSAVSTCQHILGTLRRERRMPRLNKAAEKNGLKTKPLPGTYKDGNARFAYEAGKKETRKLLNVPARFVMALTGFNEEGQAAKPGASVLFDATQRDPDDAGKEYTLYTRLTKGAKKGNSTVSMRLARKINDREEPYTIHRVAQMKFSPATGKTDEKENFVALRDVEIDGRKLQASDHRDMVRAVHFVRDSVMQTHHGVMPDMSDILGYTNLQGAISGLPPLDKKEKQRYTFRVLGGNPTGPRLFKEDDGIGANCFLHLYEWHDDKGKYNAESVMVDCGTTPLSRKKTGFDGMMSFAGEYFEHRFNTKHKPKHKVDTLAITHPHLDHFLGLPHLLLAGYVVDHVACSLATKLYIEKACTMLDVPPEYMPKKWTVIKKEEDLKVGKFDISFGWVPHSAITNWINVKTPEGSTFHFSDAKADPHVMSHPPANEERVASMKPTLAVVDSTRSMKDDETQSEKELEDEIVAFAKEHPDKGMIGFHIGSNAARMTTFVNAYGRTGRHTVIFGAAIQFLKKVLDAVGLRSGFGLKAHAREKFGTKVLNYTPNAKGAKQILDGAPGKQGILGTGTHNEIMSIANRLIENKDRKNLGFITPDKYVIVMSQTGIPGNRAEWQKMIDWMERRGFEYRVIHASGHEGKKGIKKMMGWAGAPFGVVTHGNVFQRGHAEDIVKELDMKALNPGEQDVIQVSDKNGCKIVAQEPSTMVYFSIKRPDGQHWGGGEDVEYYAHMVNPEIRTPVGDMLKDIRGMKRNSGGMPNHYERSLNDLLDKDPVLNMEGSSLQSTQKRVKISLPDYLVQNGILRRIVYDCETTQLGRHAWITQFAAKQSDWMGKGRVKRMNIRQTLPTYVLPDLDALLVTGVLPSSLYKTGKNYHPPRRFYHEIVKFLQNSKSFGLKGQKRIWIDRAEKHQDPSKLKSKAKSKDDPYMKQSQGYSFKVEKKFKDAKSITTKTLIGGFNNTRSDDVWLQHAGFRAGALRYSPTNTGGMRRFDLRNMARMFAYLRPDKFKVRKKPENPEFLDFTVKGIMKANRLNYGGYKAHDAGADVEMEDSAILGHMLKIDPELFTQNVLNATPKEVKKLLAGTHNGMLYPRHLVTYINTLAKDAKANVGVYVGRSTDSKHRNKALLFNVSDFDPKDFKDMSAQQLSEIMSSPKHRLNKAFEVVQINKHPLLSSADRGFAVGANRETSIEAMKGYKHFIERHPQMAAKMIQAMERARFIPDHDPGTPMEQRIYSAPFMEMSSHDRELAKLFDPSDEQEFADPKFADNLNRERAHAIDKFHGLQVRERYVAVMYQIEREYEQLFGQKKKYLHDQDRARERAKEKARVHGLIDTEAVSLGRLDAQIKRAHQNWDERMKDKTPAERKLSTRILHETEALVQDIKTKIANNDPEWALTKEDYARLGLDDNVPYGRYRPPASKTAAPRPKKRAPGQ